MGGILQDNLLGPHVFPKGLTLTIKHHPLYEKKKKNEYLYYPSRWTLIFHEELQEIILGTACLQKKTCRRDLIYAQPTPPEVSGVGCVLKQTQPILSFLLSPLSSTMTARAPASQINGVEHRPLQSRLQTFSFWASRREAVSLFNHQRCFP